MMFPQEYLDYEQKMIRMLREQHRMDSYFLEDSTVTGHTPWASIIHKRDSKMIPSNADQRKAIPVYSGFMVYFPLAICEVAKHSQISNEQHNPGEPMHWDRSKSTDEQDSAARHMLGTAVSHAIDDLQEEIAHATAQAWRSMANLEKLCEARDEAITFNDGPAGGCMSDWGPGEREEFENSKSQKLNEEQPHFNRNPKEQEEYLAQLNEGHGCGGQPETYRYRAPDVVQTARDEQSERRQKYYGRDAAASEAEIAELHDPDYKP